MAMTARLTNENLKISVRHIGNSREPVLVVDDVLRDPNAVIARARADENWVEAAPGGYPGARTGLPKPYAREIIQRLDPIIRQRFTGSTSSLDRFECAFSKVTRAATDLRPIQKLPHIDVANPQRIAVLHYFCDPPHGGTAFFRQDATGLERVDPADRRAFLDAQHDLCANLDSSAGFPTAQTPGYTQIATVEARLNRVLMYRSNLLHSGIINSGTPSSDRLTANFFLDYAEPV